MKVEDKELEEEKGSKAKIRNWYDKMKEELGKFAYNISLFVRVFFL